MFKSSSSLRCQTGMWFSLLNHDLVFSVVVVVSCGAVAMKQSHTRKNTKCEWTEGKLIQLTQHKQTKMSSLKGQTLVKLLCLFIRSHYTRTYRIITRVY